MRWHRWAAGVVGAALVLGGGGFVAAEEARIIGDRLERPGLAAFYAQPADAATGAPGTLVKAEELLGVPLASRGWRLMYRSTDLNGDPVVVTGVLVVPVGPAPPGGRKVVSWGHPTTGADPDCAPSRGFDPTIGIEGLRLMLDRGYAVVATDYAGMGTDGPDSYLIGVTEGNNVLDAVRAARAIPDAQASDRVVLWGHSQGGQAVLFAAERAASYAPELRIEAVAAAAPAADLRALLSAHLDDISGVTIGAYAFTAFGSVYGSGSSQPVPGADLTDILTPEALQTIPEMNKLCLLSNIDQLHRIGDPLVGAFTTSDPTTTEPWATLLADNSAGSVGFDAPLLLVQGLSDQLIVPTDTESFAAHERSLGIEVAYEQIPLATHATIAYAAIPFLALWLDSVLPR